MGPRLVRNKKLFRLIANAPLKVQKRLLSSADRDFIFSCGDCCKNILDGRINIPSKSQQKLFQYKAAVRKLGQTSHLSLKSSRKMIQTGGFWPVLSGIFGRK